MVTQTNLTLLRDSPANREGQSQSLVKIWVLQQQATPMLVNMGLNVRE